MTTGAMAILLGQLLSPAFTKPPFIRIASMLVAVIALLILTRSAPSMLMLQYFQEQAGA